MGEDQEAQPSQGSSKTSVSPSGDGEEGGGYAEFDACGPQEATEIGGFKLSRQLEVANSESQSEERS